MESCQPGGEEAAFLLPFLVAAYLPHESGEWAPSTPTLDAASPSPFSRSASCASPPLLAVLETSAENAPDASENSDLAMPPN